MNSEASISIDTFRRNLEEDYRKILFQVRKAETLLVELNAKKEILDRVLSDLRDIK